MGGVFLEGVQRFDQQDRPRWAISRKTNFGQLHDPPRRFVCVPANVALCNLLCLLACTRLTRWSEVRAGQISTAASHNTVAQYMHTARNTWQIAEHLHTAGASSANDAARDGAQHTDPRPELLQPRRSWCALARGTWSCGTFAFSSAVELDARRGRSLEP